MIFNIQRFSTHDGEGIRTIVFFKGCPLRCSWCSNPESQSFGPSLMYDSRLCRNFLECIATGSEAIKSGVHGIEIKETSDSEIIKLKDICPSRALVVSGEEKSFSDILSEIGKDLPFYRASGGGVTLSGGEPLSQGPALTDLLTELKHRNVNVAIETSLHVPWENIERCINLTGTFLADLKHTELSKFSRFTGGDASLVMRNLKRLSELHDDIIIRIPVIPGFNHTKNEIEEIINFVLSLKTIREIHFLPYHNLGMGKYRMLGIENSFESVKKVETEEVAGYISFAESKGLIAKSGG